MPHFFCSLQEDLKVKFVLVIKSIPSSVITETNIYATINERVRLAPIEENESCMQQKSNHKTSNSGSPSKAWFTVIFHSVYN